MSDRLGFRRGVVPAVLMLAVVGLGVKAAADERILSFDSRTVVHADASMTVTEALRVRAEGEQIKHGIYRDFPQLYRGAWGLTRKTGFEVSTVRQDGQAVPFRLENRENGKRVYIGAADARLPPGEHTYELVYRTDRQLGFFQDRDELYWNATGNDWAFPIDQATATVVLPAGVRASSQEAYTGPAGSRGRDYTIAGGGTEAVTFSASRVLVRGEGMTVVVGWPKGAVAAPVPRDEWMGMVRDNPGLVAAVAGLLLVLVYYMIVWAAVGKDPRAGTIVPLYGPPKGFSPAAVRYLVRMGFDNKAYAAALIDLAVKGAVTLGESGGEYVVRRKDLAAPNLTVDEQALFSKMLGARMECALKDTNHEIVSGSRKAMRGKLALFLEKTYFVKNMGYWLPGLMFSVVPVALSLIGARQLPVALFMLVWLSIWTAGVTALVSHAFGLWRSGHWFQGLFASVFAIPFVAGECFGLWAFTSATSVWVPVLFVFGAAMNGVFYHLLKAPTAAGRRILDQIDGFRMYLSVAEKERLNLENPPAHTPQLFEMFLPYALALDVEQQWAEKFADVLAIAGRNAGGYSPKWYSGTAWSSLGVAAFAGSLGSSLSSAISSASTAPGSSSGGGGGGSSGGGGGGGGGGGW